MDRILVTGGAGYIGSHICKALAQKGYEPVTLDNLSLGHAWAVKWGPLIEGDIGDQELVRKVIDDYQVVGTIHLAALSNVRESEQIPLAYYQNNVEKTVNLLQVLEERVPCFVFSSTCAVYGIPQHVPIEETHPQYPISTYGESKWMVEKALQKTGLRVATLRYFNASGADPEGEIGECHTPETHLIPLLIQTAMGQRETFTLYGNDHDTPDGTPIRDFIHVTDLADAHVLALEKLLKGEKALTLNLGTGKGYSVQEVIETLNHPISLIQGERFAGDPPILVAGASQAKDVLGWEPKYSDLSTILETAWRWHQCPISSSLS
ncbi:UDP-glucose 4-epimerase GalE [Candidatus Neptunochlamydia vexilliferae]|uniref:UDP-glucose 4-epimerase n=1 Tax=Candidatus Neptunichlamydia vexilliferae TaxID=1651774 RepID=A0ABS0AYF7_9BACT|nr:UDP-glucose 4-epimerase GalE [Candidatus Neptunochlamydia vexilliferae]MBF5059158.1 UDP-glucose 4-epimerase [Candidatus Neptunochlamydia vexilliferae]